MQKEPRYRNLKFETTEAFEAWLDEKWKFRIELKDYGQDLQELWLDEEGEILHCDLQTSIWCGKFVALSFLQKGESLRMHLDGKWKEMSFTIRKIYRRKK